MGKWIKPDVNTKFHIDFDWWEKQGRSLRVFLHSQLCPQCRTVYTTYRDTELIDWVDPETAEVHQVDGLWHALRTHCSQLPDYIDERTPLTSAIFRVFLANNNTPLSPVELHEIIGKRSPEIILRTIAGKQVYKGIKPVATNENEDRKK
ncbi:MAG: hypothetical protein DRI52_03275 [Chloroflexi bacterium]|nr:MAG: hypothetical protein DRI52_03275 [Chloroflexota bacterium]